MKYAICATFGFLIFFSNLKAQQNFCSLVPNGNFTSSNYSSTDPFGTALVSGWSKSHGTPIFNASSPHLPNGGNPSPEFEADYNVLLSDIGSGIRTNSKITFQAGKKYYLVFNYKNSYSTIIPDLKVALVSTNFWGTTGNTLPTAGLTFQNISTISGIAVGTSWTKKTICFTATYTSADLWFYMVSNAATGLCKAGIDDVEIYEDFDFAGTPKTRYTCDNPVVLGLTPTSPCIPLNALPTHSWHILGSTSIISTSQSITVSPSVSTTYVIERDNGNGVSGEGCTTIDQVQVIVASKPVFTLGPDQTVCQCSPVSLSPTPLSNDPCVTYQWNDGSNTIPKIIDGNYNTIRPNLTQSYTLTATNNCTGCTYSQTINLTFKPVPNCHGKTIYVCPSELPLTITTKGVGITYNWISVSAIPPTAPTNTPSLIINSIGKYICEVTDNPPCTIGYDTINVLPWDSIPLKIATTIIVNPCNRQFLYLVNEFDPTTVLKWYKDGVYVATTNALGTNSDGVYMAEYTSPGGLCVKQATYTLFFVDPPTVTLPTTYGSFCKNSCDVELTFTFCDNCTPSMGHLNNYSWTGPGVSSRLVNGDLKWYFCAKDVPCGNNTLKLTLTYSRNGIICTKDYFTNAFKVCPLQLDLVPDLCENDPDIFLLSLGNKFSSATVIGSGVYNETVTGYFKFSPTIAGIGSHTIKYYYDDGAGCAGWDSIIITIHKKPKVQIWITKCTDGPPSFNVLLFGSQEAPETYYVTSSEFSGSTTYSLGARPNYATVSFWGSTGGVVIPGHTYWYKVCNSHGCCDSAGVIGGTEKPIKLHYDTTKCVAEGVQFWATYDGDLITGTNYPATLAYVWDAETSIYISSHSGTDPQYTNMVNRILAHPIYSTYTRYLSHAATHVFNTYGWHRIRVLTLGGCEYIDSIFVTYKCGVCPFPEPQDIIIDGPNVVWENLELKQINGTVFIRPGANLRISNSLVVFAPCSKIIVQNAPGFGGTNNAATLTIENSTLQGCPTWKGIEVWGTYDLYDYNGINISLGEDPRTYLTGSRVISTPLIPNTTFDWAYVYAFNSTIKDADIAIFSGMIDATDHGSYNPLFTGGMVFVNNCKFSNNYTDIVFTPRPGSTLTSNSESWNASYVVKSTFTNNRSTASCNEMYWFIKNGTKKPNGKLFDNINPNCHIVDLTETQYSVAGIPTNYYYFNGPGFIILNYGPNPHINTLKRDARIPLTVWHPLHQYDASMNPYNNSNKSDLEAFKNIFNINCNNW